MSFDKIAFIRLARGKQLLRGISDDFDDLVAVKDSGVRCWDRSAGQDRIQQTVDCMRVLDNREIAVSNPVKFLKQDGLCNERGALRGTSETRCVEKACSRPWGV